VTFKLSKKRSMNSSIGEKCHPVSDVRGDLNLIQQL
jgi:hypothetical protein